MLRILKTTVYWLAVAAISVTLVIALILWVESRDASEIDRPSGTAAAGRE